MIELKRAIHFLASRCDGAIKQDRAGLNKIDTHLGHQLASLNSWTPRQARAAWRMLRKYRVQLQEAGIDYAAIPEPPKITDQDYAPKRITCSDSAFVVHFPYDADLVSAVKQIPTARFQHDSKTWAVRAQVASIEPLLRFVVENNFEFADKVVDLIDSTASTHTEAVQASRAEDAEIKIDGLGGELRPFQKAGVAYALAKKRCFIADEMGLGKTIEALATIQAAQAYPALVVCPASLKLNWQREAEKWLPGKTVSVLNGKNDNGVFDADIVIINYDVLKKNLDALQAKNFKAIVCDESHYLKNFKAQRTEAAKALCAKRDYRLFLTGTPLLNRPQELLSQLGAMGRIEEMGGFWPFAKRYCRAYQSRWGWDMSGAAHLEELNEKLRATCYVRRNKKDVLRELPAKQRAEVPIAISNRAEYSRAERELIAWLRDQAVENKTFLESIKDLSEKEQRAVKNARADDVAEKAARAERLVKIEALKKIAARGKLEAAREWIESFLETGEKLVVFAWHREIVNEVASMFSCDSITGETSLEKRQAAVDKFQSDPETKIIVLNVQAGGVGITLTAASNVIFLELGWTPAVHDQAEDRCHRIGQEDRVTAWYLLAEQTIDQQINALIESKRTVVDAATEGEAGASELSVMNEVIKNLMESKPARS